MTGFTMGDRTPNTIEVDGVTYKLKTLEQLSNQMLINNIHNTKILRAEFETKSTYKNQWGYILLFVEFDRGYITRIQSIYKDDNGNPRFANNDISALIQNRITEIEEIPNLKNTALSIQVRIQCNKDGIPRKNNENETFLTFEIVNLQPLQTQHALPQSQPVPIQSNEMILCTSCNEQILKTDYTQHLKEHIERGDI